MKLQQDILLAFTSLLATTRAVATFDSEDQTFAAVERVLSTSSTDDCPLGSVRETNFISIDFSIDVADREDVSCTIEDFERFPDTIQTSILNAGLSGAVRDQLTDSPIIFDVILCSRPNNNPALDVFERLRGRNLCGSCWPYTGGGSGGCSDCGNSNCDDDTGADNPCRRRELFVEAITEDDRAAFLPVKIPVEQDLQNRIRNDLQAAVSCLQGKELLVEVVFDMIALDEIHLC